MFYNEKLEEIRTVLADDRCKVTKRKIIGIIVMYLRQNGSGSGTGLTDRLERCHRDVYRDGKTSLTGDLKAKLDTQKEERSRVLLDTISKFALYGVNDPNVATSCDPKGSSTIDVFATSSKSAGPESSSWEPETSQLRAVC